MANIITSTVSAVTGTAADAAGAAKDAAVGTAGKLFDIQGFLDSWNVFSNFGKMAQNDALIKQLLGQFGLSMEQMSELRDTMYDNAMVSASLWGKEMKDVIELQVKYNEATGRSIILGRENYDEQFALNKLIGETGSQYTQTMQNFNVSVESAYSQFGNLYDKVEKHGLNLKKVSDNVVKNLNMADHITFRNGTAGLMNMAVWAEKVKFSVQNIEGLVNKVTSNFESTISMSAKLQVLGGPFTALADPLAMMEEGFNNPEALTQRMATMISNLATFNSKTGEFDLKGMYPQLAIRQYAEQTGVSVEDARKSAKEQARRQYVESQLGSDLTSEEKSLISSKAEYDRVNQKFYVRDYKGERRWIEDINQTNITSINSNVAADADSQTRMYTAAAGSLGYIDLFNNAARTIALSQQQLLDKSWAEDLTKFGLDIRNTLGNFSAIIKEIADADMPGIDKIEHWFASFASLFKSWGNTEFGEKLMAEIEKLATGNFNESDTHKVAKKIAESFLGHIWNPLMEALNTEIESGNWHWDDPNNGIALLVSEITSFGRQVLTPLWDDVIQPLITRLTQTAANLGSDLIGRGIPGAINLGIDAFESIARGIVTALANVDWSDVGQRFVEAVGRVAGLLSSTDINTEQNEEQQGNRLTLDEYTAGILKFLNDNNLPTDKLLEGNIQDVASNVSNVNMNNIHENVTRSTTITAVAPQQTNVEEKATTINTESTSNENTTKVTFDELTGRLELVVIMPDGSRKNEYIDAETIAQYVKDYFYKENYLTTGQAYNT